MFVLDITTLVINIAMFVLNVTTLLINITMFLLKVTTLVINITAFLLNVVMLVINITTLRRNTQAFVNHGEVFVATLSTNFTDDSAAILRRHQQHHCPL